MRVDNRCDRVRRIVKPIDEFETKRDQQSDAKQEKGQYADNDVSDPKYPCKCIGTKKSPSAMMARKISIVRAAIG